jgi:predicted nuclease with TOPRIM domain
VEELTVANSKLTAKLKDTNERLDEYRANKRAVKEDVLHRQRRFEALRLHAKRLKKESEEQAASFVTAQAYSKDLEQRCKDLQAQLQKALVSTA